MSISNDAVIEQLRRLQLTTEEAKLYLELLRRPSTHLQLAHTTGINRTTIYRIASQLEKRLLITAESDAHGTFLKAADPRILESALTAQEKILQEQRDTLSSLMPNLMAIKEGDTRSFVERTYQGTDGFKQMLTHELETKGEMLVLGGGTLPDLIDDDKWIERHRTRSLGLGHTARILLNPGNNILVYTFDMASVAGRLKYRVLPAGTIYLQNQVVTYNDTAAVYHWRDGTKMGVEIINKNYATLMRQMFEYYWDIAGRHGKSRVEPILTGAASS